MKSWRKKSYSQAFQIGLSTKNLIIKIDIDLLKTKEGTEVIYILSDSPFLININDFKEYLLIFNQSLLIKFKTQRLILNQL
jgi:hypothetical protein